MAASSLTDRSGLRTVSPATRTLPARIRACARWRDSASPLFVTSTSSLVILVVHPGKRSPIHRPISAERPAGADAGVGGPGACRHASARCAPPRATPALASAVWAAPWRADSQAHHYRINPTPMPIAAPTSTSNGVWPSSSRSIGSWTPRMWTRSSTSRFRIAAWRPAARRRPAASYMTTNEKISAIANSGESTWAYLPTAVARPATIALWLLGIPPVSASTRRFSLCCRTEVRVTLATWQIVQATIGASKYFNPAIVRRGRPPWLSGTSGELRPRRGAGRRARGPRRARLAGRYPRPASRWFARGSTGGLRSWAEAECSSHRRGDATQDAVDEASRLVAREGLGELDRFVDGGFGRYAAVDRDLVYGDTKNDAVNIGHQVELTVDRGLAEDGVQFLPVGYDPTHQLAGKGRDVRGRRALTRVIEQHLLGIIIRSLELKQDLERQLPGLVPLPQSLTC